ncbi:MAG: cbb3-type cytochrome c oxidase subunit I [Gemmataceae bacterium]
MSTAFVEPRPDAYEPRPITRADYLNVAYGVRSWLLTLDHKRIALLYLVSVSVFFFVGGVFAAIVRIELMTPRGDLVSSDTYNKLFTMHGVVMIFFFLIPATPATLGNFLVPLMIGAKDLAYPKLNLASWYIFMLGGLFGIYAMITGGVDTGWTFYTPLSTRTAHSQVIPAALAALITGFSSLLTGLNFLVTIHKMRAPGLTWFRLPLFIWAMYATSLVILLGTPVVTMVLILVAIERLWGIGIFDPSIGGDPVLFQHLFWFYSHPAVYIMILPAMGVISEIVTTFCKKVIFGYHFIAFSSVAIATLGFFVWGHHMYVSSQSPYAGLIFSLLSMLVAIPSAIKVFNWTATMWRGSVSWQTPMMYGFGFIGLFTVGGLTGLFLGVLGTDVHVTMTYFVVAHFHYVMVGGAIMGYLGGLHYWWPKMTGRMYPDYWGRLAAIIIFIGFNLTFFPQFLVGYQGMPRRYHEYVPEYQVLNVLSTAGASILGLGYLMPAIYLPWSLRYAKEAGKNPWGATGLEWSTTSPPPADNFAVTPVVTMPPYIYSKEEAEVV